jgi:radical SAM protein with 4Fe4S-binding SPASM domain
VVVSVVCESVELAVEVAVVFLSVTGNTSVEGDTVCRTSVASKSAEFAVWNPSFTARCSGVIEVVVATPAFDGLGVNTEFICELTNRVRPWHFLLLFTTGTYL